MMATLRHLFAWAVKEGHVEATPFMKNGLTVIDVRTAKRSHRKRRLDREANEETRLLRAASPDGALGLGGRAPGMATHLHDLIIAALESGCRKGELLSLQWSQVKDKDGVAHYIDLPADKTKTNEPRKVPITSRLRAILDFRRIGPDGEEHPMDAYVFGDEAGERIKNVKTAWRAACRRAGIDGLNFHDLRHEFTSAMLDAGVPIHKVRDWVGHKNISTTSIYANTTLSHLEDALKTFERRETGAPLVHASHSDSDRPLARAEQG
jgi:integrase